MSPAGEWGKCIHETFQIPGHERQRLLNAKVLQYTAALSQVAWTRFQNNFYLERGFSLSLVGSLKGIGLLMKLLGEPIFSVLADVTEPRYVYTGCMIFGTMALEILRVSKPLDFSVVLWVKLLRIAVSPVMTLVTTASLALVEGSKEGYGNQRAFGSLAWGTGAFIAGWAIDRFGIDAVFYMTYMCNFVCILVVLNINVLPAQMPLIAKTNPKVETVNQRMPNGLTVMEDSLEQASEASLDNEDGSNSSGSSINNNSDSSGGSSSDGVRWCAFPTPLATKCGSSFEGMMLYGEQYRGFIGSGAIKTLLFNVLAYGTIMQVHDTFIYLLLERDFHASRTFSGLLTTVAVLSTLPLFWYADSLIKNYGHYRMILVSQTTCLLRLLIVSTIDPYWNYGLHVILLTQIIHGLNFALFWSAAVDLMAKLAHPDIKNGCMAALNMAYYTLGAAAGSFAWGAVDLRWGSMRVMYLIAAAATILMILITYIMHHTPGMSLYPTVPPSMRNSNIRNSSRNSNSSNIDGNSSAARAIEDFANEEDSEDDEAAPLVSASPDTVNFT